MIATLVNAAVVIACALLGNFLQRDFLTDCAHC